MSLTEVAFLLRFGYIYDPAMGKKLSESLLNDVPKAASMKLTPQLFPELTNVIKSALTDYLISIVATDPLPALFLSGGIDSPLIAAIAQSLSQKPLKAFTFSSQGEAMDEAGQAARYAQEIGLEHRTVTLDPDRLPQIVMDLISQCDEPPGDYSIIPTYLVCHEARKHSNVILSGDGADELFWGYASRMSRVIRLAPLFRLPKTARKLRWWLLRRPYEWNARYFDTVGEWYRSGHEHNFEGWLKQIFPTLPPLTEELALYDYAGNDQADTAYWVRLNEFTGHMQAGLTKTRMAAKVAGINVESPFLDDRMVKFASGLDWRSCLDIEKDVGKLPLRALLAKYVSKPSTGKLGFNVPMGSWLRGPLNELFEKTVLSRDALMGLEINRRAMRDDFEQHLSGKIDRAWGLWIFLSLAIWEDTHQGKLLDD